jgi:hypothetical protein
MDSQTDHLRGGHMWIRAMHGTRSCAHISHNARDTVLCSYFAQRSGTESDGCGQRSQVEEIFQGLDRFE